MADSLASANLRNATASTLLSSSPATTGAATATKSLGKDDFLKLFLAQMQNQDPQKTQDNSQFMAQLAQFSQLEQMTNMTKAQDDVLKSNQLASASTMIGKNIDVRDTNGSIFTGKVTSVRIVEGAPKLMIGLREFDMKDLVQVK